MKPTLSWVAVAVAGAVVLVIGFLIAALWIGIGDSEISGAGWLAMGLGVIVTLALGDRADGAGLYQQPARL